MLFVILCCVSACCSACTVYICQNPCLCVTLSPFSVAREESSPWVVSSTHTLEELLQASHTHQHNTPLYSSHQSPELHKSKVTSHFLFVILSCYLLTHSTEKLSNSCTASSLGTVFYDLLMEKHSVCTMCVCVYVSTVYWCVCVHVPSPLLSFFLLSILPPPRGLRREEPRALRTPEVNSYS